MNALRIKLFVLSVLASLISFGQVSLTQYHIGVGNSSNQLSGSTNLQYASGILTMGSSTDNYLAFNNQAGTSYMQADGNGHFVWWTPENGNRKMMLTNSGKLKIGQYYVTSGADAGSTYKLQVDGGGYFRDHLATWKDMNNATVGSAGFYSASTNTYRLQGNITNSAYHTAQENQLNVMSGTISGYQSSAQRNTFYAYNQSYTDGGPGHIWSVQTNNFYPDGGSNLSKFINTYIRTQLGTNNTIGTYYSLFLESPYGGSISQIANYYGVYQESSSAKNYFAGKVGIGTTSVSDADYKLFVDGGIRTRKVRVDQSTWSDYVFDAGYKLPTLKDVEEFIKQNKHLPDVPSARDVEKNGLDLGDNQALLLKKIEELTLYIIAQDKEIQNLKSQNKELLDLKKDVEIIKTKLQTNN